MPASESQEAASGLWRSESMVKADVVIERDYIREILFNLGCTGMMQFIDTVQTAGASVFQRPYAADVRRCDDIQRQLRYIAEQMKKCDIATSLTPTVPQAALEDLNVVGSALEEAERELRELNSATDGLLAERNNCSELYEVLRRNIDDDPPNVAETVDYGNGYQNGAVLEEQQSITRHRGLMYVAGVIPDKAVHTLHVLVYRASRGNCVVRVDPIETPYAEADGKSVQKSVFVIYVSSEIVLGKIQKVAVTVGAHMYNYTANNEKSAAALKAQLKNFDHALGQNEARKAVVLSNISRFYPQWNVAVECEKQVYSTMNLFSYHGSVATGRCWISSADLETISRELESGALCLGAHSRPIFRITEDQRKPPTKFPSNKFTLVFQSIVSSYGVPRYKEVNPTVLTIITFPFLFGMMFGDIGHGLILAVVGGTLIFLEPKFQEKKLSEILGMLFIGRYLILMMGVMAVYFGVLYNDFFGISLGLFESAYTWPTLREGGPLGMITPIEPDGRPSVKPPFTYPLGIDVSWTGTENKLEFYNSVKMKCAVIIGILQMLAGLFCSLLNHVHRHEYRKVFLQFIPEVVFLSCTFGYMAILIIVKWCMSFDGRTNTAPSLLETMTNFFLQPGSVAVELFSGQAVLQLFLFLIAFSMVPILLLGIPMVESRRRKNREAARRQQRTTFSEAPSFEALPPRPSDIYANDVTPSARATYHHHNEEEEEEPFGEIVIHAIIHTIEFVLGCVSNTASYLRLWALSLAHAQLSEVFFEFGVVRVLDADPGIGLLVIYLGAAWLCATIGVLCCMEALSAFLHTLRLHWVEFQNKFYVGDGYSFQPFDLGAVANHVHLNGVPVGDVM